MKPREINQVPNTLGVRHECAERGLIAPPLSTMFARKDETNSLVCVWECALSHIRSPFNSFPPMYNAADKDQYMCVPIPKDFTAVRFAFDVHLRVSTSGPVVLTQSFYDPTFSLSAPSLAHGASEAKMEAGLLVPALRRVRIFGGH